MCLTCRLRLPSVKYSRTETAQEGREDAGFRRDQVHPAARRAKEPNRKPVITGRVGEDQRDLDPEGREGDQRDRRQQAQQRQRAQGDFPPRLAQEVSGQNVVQGGDMDEHARHLGRVGRHPQVVSAGGGSGDEDDLVFEDLRVQVGFFPVVDLLERRENLGDGINGVNPV